MKFLTDSHGRHWQSRLGLPVVYRSGAKARDLMGDLEHMRADVLFIHVGTNNITTKTGLPNQKPKEITAEIEMLCARAKCICPHVIFSSILPRTSPNWYNDRARYINRKLKVSLVQMGVFFLDHTRAFLSGKYSVHSSLLSIHDGLHLSYDGKSVMVSSFNWVLAELF